MITIMYREIAKQRGITIEQVRKEIEDSLQQSYQNPNRTVKMKQLQDEVRECKGTH